jgi:RNA polymerase sigma factor (sigma-70 family)
LTEVEQLQSAFAKLSPAHQEVILLRRVEGLTYPEMGIRLGLTVHQVERRLAQAIYELDSALNERQRPWWRFW